MNQERRLKRAAFVVGIVLLLLVLAVVFAYVVNFCKATVSDKSSDWGTFGDYIGGLLNPIIGLFSLLAIGYLTYFVSKAGSDESRSVFLLQQRMQAYQGLTTTISNYNKIKDRLKLHNELMVKQGIGQQEAVNQYVKGMESTLLASDLRVEIGTFQLRWAHLFKYNFTSPDYIYLKEAAEKIYWGLSSTAVDPTPTEAPVDDAQFEGALKRFVAAIASELK